MFEIRKIMMFEGTGCLDVTPPSTPLGLGNSTPFVPYYFIDEPSECYGSVSAFLPQ